ncbi:MAG: hypothetical protein DME25_02760 [Verrucomicrobia bacterium]|nr:MAG: hypothetical protein DME25_02760 [Verrucomicrobiota bacterium]
MSCSPRVTDSPTVDTKSRTRPIQSVTKQFTAMCILILQEDHKLNVTNLIEQYVEDCPKAWSNITIHHLLTHTAGIPNYTELPDDFRRERLPTTAAATVKLLIDKPLDFTPGTKMHYSNSGYVLLGYIIEKVTGKSYERALREKIFQPLGMNRSGYDHPATILAGRASGYGLTRFPHPFGTNIVNCIPFAMDLVDMGSGSVLGPAGFGEIAGGHVHRVRGARLLLRLVPRQCTWYRSHWVWSRWTHQRLHITS